MQCLAEGERILGVHGIVAEKTIERAMHIVGAGFGHYVDGRTGGCAQVGGVVAAIDLEFLHIVLAYRQAHAAAIT